MKIKWIVQPAPTGRYRSFERRGWPKGESENGDPVARIECGDAYAPKRVKTGDHAPLRVGFAFATAPEELATKGTFTWQYLKARFATLSEAKAAAQEFYERYPEKFYRSHGAE